MKKIMRYSVSDYPQRTFEEWVEIQENDTDKDIIRKISEGHRVKKSTIRLFPFSVSRVGEKNDL